MSAKGKAIAGGVLVGLVVLILQEAQRIKDQGGIITAAGLGQGVINDLATNGGKLLEAVLYQSRGIRNNNPGNIRRGIAWQGMAAAQTDAEFIQFVSPEYGIRAMNKILDTYARSYGLNTVRGIVTRWAPPTENNTAAYIKSVAAQVGVSPDAQIGAQHRAALIEAIIRHENGQQPYTLATINAGVSLA